MDLTFKDGYGTHYHHYHPQVLRVQAGPGPHQGQATAHLHLFAAAMVQRLVVSLSTHPTFVLTL